MIVSYKTKKRKRIGILIVTIEGINFIPIVFMLPMLCSHPELLWYLPEHIVLFIIGIHMIKGSRTVRPFLNDPPKSAVAPPKSEKVIGAIIIASAAIIKASMNSPDLIRIKSVGSSLDATAFAKALSFVLSIFILSSICSLIAISTFSIYNIISVKSEQEMIPANRILDKVKKAIRSRKLISSIAITAILICLAYGFIASSHIRSFIIKSFIIPPPSAYVI